MSWAQGGKVSMPRVQVSNSSCMHMRFWGQQNWIFKNTIRSKHEQRVDDPELRWREVLLRFLYQNRAHMAACAIEFTHCVQAHMHQPIVMHS